MRNLRLAGPSANPLMTADEYERNRRTESNALRASVERHYPAWTDAHIPRTEKPVRFKWAAPLVVRRGKLMGREVLSRIA